MTDSPAVPGAPAASHDAAHAADPSAALLAALREATGVDTLDFDEDRDVGLRYASLPVLVRLVERPPRVRIHAIVLDDAEPGVELLARFDALNAQAGGIRWFSSGRRVVAVTEIPAAPIVAAHVAQALHGFCETVEGIARAMRLEFGEGGIRLAGGGEGWVLH
jgi:hypothetical protein